MYNYTTELLDSLVIWKQADDFRFKDLYDLTYPQLTSKLHEAIKFALPYNGFVGIKDTSITPFIKMPYPTIVLEFVAGYDSYSTGELVTTLCLS